MATKDLNVILGLRIENFQKNLSKAQRSSIQGAAFDEQIRTRYGTFRF
jgi:hypothetical protein